tara:strand:+ start:185 stop:370 length:186 start_codon:yes stop_codon:yes gene_type:complete
MKDIIVKTQIRNVAEQFDQNKVINISNDFFVELSKKVENIVKKSCERARANGRNTIMGKDV